jgi:hypothetical protein
MIFVLHCFVVALGSLFPHLGLVFGIVGNAVQYINNEGWNPRYSSSNGSAPTNSKRTNADHSNSIAISIIQQTTLSGIMDNNSRWSVVNANENASDSNSDSDNTAAHDIDSEQPEHITKIQED